MIKINVDSCIFVDGDARCDGNFSVIGDYDNVALEIYAILKAFEKKVPRSIYNCIRKWR